MPNSFNGGKTTVCLKVDVDTYEGMKNGIPRLLEFLEKEKVPASFYFSYGPDQSGKAVKRVLRKGFLKKMFKTKAAKLYGFKTMLYGTLLPSPLIASAMPQLILQTKAAGHEVGVHAWNHVLWQDELDNISEEKISVELANAVKAHKEITGENPSGFAAPAWKINEKALKVLNETGFAYTSIGRGITPCMPFIGKTKAAALEIPTTMPTLDEILAWDEMDQNKALEYYSAATNKNTVNVYTLHTEAEGGAYFEFFKSLINNWKNEGCDFKLMKDYAAFLRQTKLTEKEFKQGELKGRSGLVATV